MEAIDLELVQSIIGLLPDAWQPHIAAILQLMAMLSVVVAALKPLIARLVKSRQGRAWWDAVFKVLDMFAANTRGLDTRPLPAPKGRR